MTTTTATTTTPPQDLIEAITKKRKEITKPKKSTKTEKLFNIHNPTSTMSDKDKSIDPNKAKALEAALGQISKNFGDGAIMRLGEAKKVNVATVSSGSISLDLALGGGMPKGRVIEIYGPESSGKTTMALHTVAEFQKSGGQAAFVDAEHALDPEYAAKIGVDVDNLLISQPDTGEQALEIVETLVRSGAVDVIVIDSVAALTPRAEIEGAMGDSLPGLQARLMSQALRKLTAIAHKSGTTLIFLNQIRYKIGVMFGNPETTSGGNALKFYASVRLDIRRTGKIEHGTGDDKKIIGNATRVKVVKNKIAPPFRQAEFEIRYNVGIDKVSDLISTGVKFNVIKKAGAFYDIEGQKYQGLEKSRQALLADHKLFENLDKKVRAAVSGTNLDTGEVAA